MGIALLTGVKILTGVKTLTGVNVLTGVPDADLTVTGVKMTDDGTWDATGDISRCVRIGDSAAKREFMLTSSVSRSITISGFNSPVLRFFGRPFLGSCSGESSAAGRSPLFLAAAFAEALPRFAEAFRNISPSWAPTGRLIKVKLSIFRGVSFLLTV